MKLFTSNKNILIIIFKIPITRGNNKCSFNVHKIITKLNSHLRLED